MSTSCGDFECWFKCSLVWKRSRSWTVRAILRAVPRTTYEVTRTLCSVHALCALHVQSNHDTSLDFSLFSLDQACLCFAPYQCDNLLQVVTFAYWEMSAAIHSSHQLENEPWEGKAGNINISLRLKGRTEEAKIINKKSFSLESSALYEDEGEKNYFPPL